MQPSILFILKTRQQHWKEYSEADDCASPSHESKPYGHHSSGLTNSADFVNKMLVHAGLKSDLVNVVDGNDIDREVMRFNPDIIVLEAIWATPDKLRELTSLGRHKKRRWVIRNHSELPFLAMEGGALGWLLEYASIPTVYVSCNSPVANQEVTFLTQLRGHKASLFLPNYYPEQKVKKKDPSGDAIHIGCFGAIRPLTNHVEQAVGALIYANEVGKPLKFHINSTRIEGGGSPVIKTLTAVFKGLGETELVEHGWLSRPDFLKLCRKMDLGLAVSYSETFQICAADLVSQGVSCVTSDEVPWMPAEFHADPSLAVDIAEKLHLAHKLGVASQVHGLRKYAEITKRIWLDQLDKLVN